MVLTFGVVAAIVAPIKDGVSVYQMLFPPPEMLHAQRVRDEYYVKLAVFDNKQDAKLLQQKLIALSELSARLDKDPSTPIIGSSSIAIGFEQDQVIYSPSDKKKGKWIVGLDLEAGQGSTAETAQLLIRIRNRFSNIANEFRAPHPLPIAAAEVAPIFSAATVEFFSSVDYQQSYGVPLPKE